VADPANTASLRVLAKAGMKQLGVRHCYNARMVECAVSLGEWRALAGPAPAVR
jgi:RimJ/RimL family protein N-acetyltransferase